LKLGVERFLPKLRETANKIRQSFVEQQREAPPQLRAVGNSRG
jgi:hypothetical protein